MYIQFLSAALFLPYLVYGHGNMIEPPARATMHDYGFPDNPHDNNWMEGFCGGFPHQWSQEIGGKCGICGDPWDAEVRQHEAPNGRFANGVIVREYQPGEIITVTSHITANHVGFVEFRLCPNNNVEMDPDQECFDQEDAVLTIVDTGDTKFWITDAMGSGKFSTKVQLPMWECEQCIMQWTYRNGRNWGTCNGACGQVETFRGCADIAIRDLNGNNTDSTSTVINEETSTVIMEETTAGSNNEETTSDSGSEETTTDSSNIETTTDSSHEETTTDTNNEETTTPVAGGDNCRATGPWTGNPETDAWCQENCNFVDAYCPPDVCTCEEASWNAWSSTSVCESTGPWTGNEAMTQWCNNNCLRTPSFCPQSLCRCF